MSTIKIFLVEDDPDWIRAMSAYLNSEPDLEVAGFATSSREALEKAQQLDFDVVLLDIQLTDYQEEGIHTAIELNDIHPARIIMLTSMKDESIIMQAFTAGAVNYVEKTNYKELPHVIRNAYQHPRAMDALLKDYARLKREEQLRQLTAAEREVFELIEQGYTQPQMEKKLYKTESTLKNQVNKMLKKLGVTSRKEAVEKVRRKGLLPPK
ncbi:response regulator transcription factor [Paenibacillus sp. BK033]|uniref:response regulator transcription factor n=1 Tax=unclassified Paenibacillus TaxID=185978 RepID=UPI00104C3153|nr:response regulator transcription factor [Paenibacillus sp. BK033]NIK71513.1 NarL family two-component system response regulator LiaR [Paenibacillus sp. BK720]TCM96161.1 LuxR family two component transcriptional regulator [Paenibacillus sp. BK033]